MSFCVIELEGSRITEASDVLGRAFIDDPMVCAILTGMGPRGRLRRLRTTFETILRVGAPGRRDLCVSECGIVRTCALLYEPGAYPPPTLSQLMVPIHCLLRVGPRGLSGWTIWNYRIRRMHPKNPHLYLEYLGTDPPHQKRGFGSALLRHICALADKKRTICYLETANPKNLPFYEAFGFSVTASRIILGVPTWFLTRTART